MGAIADYTINDVCLRARALEAARADLLASFPS